MIPAGTYDNMDWEFRANTDRGAPLSLSGGWGLGGFYSATRFGPSATLAYRYSDKLTANLRVNYSDVRLDEGSFTTAVVRLNTSYSFTPRLYMQTNVQYNNDTRDVGTKVRIGWLDTAGTGLFLVWNDTNHRGSLERQLVGTGAGSGGGKVTRTAISRTIHALVEAVFEAVADISNFRETRKMGKGEAPTILEVTEYVKNKRVRMVSDAGGTVWDSLFKVTPVGDGWSMRLDLVMEARPYRLMARVLVTLMKRWWPRRWRATWMP
ncbi:MAG: hypothetical protein OXT72_04085 [Gammaproteobacteria bacterium]|nr:hypothetical protein [Gammaproteobacteria bacterium]MDE0248111.1 hypothetical protein [Gammaproteobacteria bacterium]